MATPVKRPKRCATSSQPASTRSNCTSCHPVSPELNLDKHVWNELKIDVVDQAVINGSDQRNSIVRCHLHHLQKLSDKIRSYFKAPATAYTLAYGIGFLL